MKQQPRTQEEWKALQANNRILRSALVVLLTIALTLSVSIPLVRAKYLQDGDVVFSAALSGISTEDLEGMLEQYKCGRETGHTACDCFSAAANGGLSMSSTGEFSVKGWSSTSSGQALLSNGSNGLTYRSITNLTAQGALTASTNLVTANTLVNFINHKLTNAVTPGILPQMGTMVTTKTNGAGIPTTGPALYMVDIANGTSNLSGVISAPGNGYLYFIGTTHGSSAYSAYSIHSGALNVGTSFSFSYARDGRAIDSPNGTETKNITGLRYARIY